MRASKPNPLEPGREVRAAQCGRFEPRELRGEQTILLDSHIHRRLQPRRMPRAKNVRRFTTAKKSRVTFQRKFGEGTRFADLKLSVGLDCSVITETPCASTCYD